MATINGTSGNDELVGFATADTINGFAGNDLLNGDSGNDIMAGSTGNDTYVVDAAGDSIIEQAGEGTDTVQSSLTLTLGANVENLVLTGTANLNGTGNALDNALTGNSGANTLDGGVGADTMAGGAGNDTYVVNSSSDMVVENSGEGTDTVQASLSWTLEANVENLVLTGTSGGLNGFGNTLDNVISGSAAGNLLDGGAGNDTLSGGFGNDLYVVDSVSDVVTENMNEGTDTVKSSVSYLLGANIENLTLTGAGSLNGTGNTLANIITGNGEANVLDGGIGADTLTGGLGSDIYIVDNVGDAVNENSGADTDTVQSSVSWALSLNVENMVLTGSAPLNGSGNTLNNVITGNSGANFLDGDIGADTLAGGLGNDVYIVDNVGDVITENSGQGTDTVHSSVSWTLGANIENLVLIGSATLNGSGNTLDNVITGNGGNNILAGGFGNDVYHFEAGFGKDMVNDTLDNGLIAGRDLNTFDFTSFVASDLNFSRVDNDYIIRVKNTADSLVVKDLYVSTFVDYALRLSTGVLNQAQMLMLVPSDQVLVGTSAGESLIGVDGNDSLTGLGGDDTLDGGVGNDKAIYQGSAGDYRLVVNIAGELLVIDKNAGNGDEGTDTLKSIEIVQFGDRNWRVSRKEEFRVNTESRYKQSGAELIGLEDGGFVVVWHLSDNTVGWSIYGQRYDANSKEVGEQFKINTDSSGAPEYPAIASLPDGGFVVVWQTYRSGIYGQRFDMFGNQRGVQFGVDTASTGAQRHPVITTLLGGGFAVAWDSESQDASNYGIHARLYSANGSPVGSEFRVDTDIQDYQQLPAIAALSDGGFVVAWMSYKADNPPYKVYCQRYSSSGVALGAEFQVDNTAAVSQSFPTITALSDGGFIVAWSAMNVYDTFSYGIYGQRYNINGSALGGEFLISTIKQDSQTFPEITELSNGKFIVVWHGDDEGDSNGVFGRIFNGNGVAAGDRFKINSSVPGVQDFPTVTALLDGGFVVAWTDSVLDGSGTGVFAKRFDANGEVFQSLVTSIIGSDLADNFDISVDSAGVIIAGGLGNDTYKYTGREGVVEYVNEGMDTVLADVDYNLGANIENLTQIGANAIGGGGNELDNILTGNTANNTLDGMVGIDTMQGGLGDDVYIVDNVSDIVTENVDEGADTVVSSVDFALGNNLENLSLTGATAISGVGNALNNTLIGNIAANTLNGSSGDDTLDGKTGADTLVGGLGNDVFIVDNIGDSLIENMSEGIDLVQSSVTYTLGSNLENLTLTGTMAIDGTGNFLANVITGNNGNNLLEGGAGNDTLKGGFGTDIAVYSGSWTSYTVTASMIVGNGETDTLSSIENIRFNGVTITLANASNDAPAGVNDTNSGDAVIEAGSGIAGDASASGSVLSNDTDADLALGVGETLTVSAVKGITGNVGATVTGIYGTLVLQSNGGYIYTLNNADADTEALSQGQNVIDSFSYTFKDAHGATSTATLNITVTGSMDSQANLAPVMTAPTAIQYTDTQYNDTFATASGTLSATDANAGDTLSYGISGGVITSGMTTRTGTYGTLMVNVATGAYTFTPNDALIEPLTANASEDFIVMVSDGALSASQALTVNIISNATTESIGDDTLIGSSANNVMNALVGNDTLDGGAGDDTLQGGTGNDTYIVDSANDIATENANEGTDTVQSNVTYTLGANLENLTLTGATAINGTGNANNNLITGNSANNALGGGAGNDTLIGGAGNDTLNGGAGSDTYRYIKGDGLDLIINTDNSVGRSDILQVSGLGFQDFTFSRTVNTLVVNAGATDSISVQDFYANAANQLDRIEYSNGAGVVNHVTGSIDFTSIDTANLQSWSSWHQVRNAQLQIVQDDIVMDNGSKSNLEYDVSNTKAWQSYRTGVDSAARADWVQVLNDDGSFDQTDFDQASTESWTVRNDHKDNTGALDWLRVQNDNGSEDWLDLDQTNAQVWKEQNRHLDSQGRLDHIQTINDDTTVDWQDEDQDSSQTWATVNSHQLADGRLDWRRYINDNGTEDWLDLDQDNTQTWTEQNSRKDNLGRDDSRFVIWDDGRKDAIDLDQTNVEMWQQNTQHFNAAGAYLGSDVLLDAGIAANTVWLRQNGNNLEVSQIGTTKQIVLADWYVNTPASQKTNFQLASGGTLLATEVQALVTAMASFSPPAVGQTSLTTAQHQALDGVIAASW